MSGEMIEGAVEVSRAVGFVWWSGGGSMGSGWGDSRG